MIIGVQTQAQTATVSGLVANDGAPVALATVMLKGTHTMQTLSDTVGHFTFEHISVGTYILQVRGVGFQTITKKLVVNAGQHLKLQLAVDPVVQQLQGITISSKEHRAPVSNVIGIGQTPMPVTVIDRKTIAQMGSRRLDEVLREQTGLAVVSDLGAGNRALGIQMQGFSSEYITILIDGQPLAGNKGNH